MPGARGSRSPRRTTACRRSPRSRPRCSTAPGRSSSCVSRRRRWGSTPRRIAACGNSAGAGISLWAGFHDDLADPGSADPVLRQSSRLACMGVVGAQTSYDPRFIKQTIGGRAHEHIALRPLFGIHSDAEADSPRISQALRGRLTPHLRLGRRSPRHPLLLRARRPASPRRPPRPGHPPPPLRRGPEGQA